MIQFFLLLGIIYPVILIGIYYFRKKKEGKETKIISLIYPFIIVFAVCSLFFSLAGIFIAKPVFSYFLNEKYQAVVVGSQPMGDSDSEAVQAVVEFTDKHGNKIKKPLNYGSSIIIPIGRTLTIAYQDGDKSVSNLSIGSQIPQLLIAGIFFVILGAVVLFMTNIAIGRSNQSIIDIALQFLVYLVFPLGILFFICALSYTMWRYFTGEKDYPIWVLGICSLFVTLLIPAFFGYIKMLFLKDKK